MANSKLMGKKFGLPPELQKFTGDQTMSYSMMKKLKNFFDYHDSSHPYYEKKGGDKMKQFIESTLNSQRGKVKKSAEIKSEFTPNNGFKKTHTKDRQTKNVTKVGGVPKVHKSTSHKRLYKGEMLYEQEIKRIQELITYKSIL
jgi:hypothetical protein